MGAQDYLDFENYLAGKMPDQDRIRFESQLQADAKLKQEFELYREASAFLEHKFSAQTMAFKDSLQQISDAEFPKKTKPKVIALRPWYYAVAASVAVVFGLLFFNNDPQYSDFSQHETAVFTERNGADANLKQAQDFFNAGDYENAVKSFEKQSDLKNPELQFFYAIALIETADYAKAQLLLENLQAGTSVYKDRASWYLALSSLRQGHTDACQNYLKQIPKDAEDYQKAQELLEDLD